MGALVLAKALEIFDCLFAMERAEALVEKPTLEIL